MHVDSPSMQQLLAVHVVNRRRCLHVQPPFLTAALQPPAEPSLH